MKVLDLGCSNSHRFEGWFGSDADYRSQLERGLLECPVCGDRGVGKLPSAPRLNLRAQEAAPVSAAGEPGSTHQADPARLQAAVLRAMRELAAGSEDVGERFAAEARRIHHGEAQPRGIRGRASLADAVELLEEGIGVLPLPDLPVFRTLQ